ncbi:hypothetical protein CCP3SC5AM1_2740001 [Gammaproteobacteria bacterium]
MNAATTVTATFDPAMYSLNVVKSGNGTVSSTPAGINCGTDCSEDYAPGTSVTLTAVAETGSTFTGWSGGGCSGNASTCMVTMNAATLVTATFDFVKYSLSVTKTGTGSGTVTSNPAGIDCGTDCTETYNTGTQVTLTATAATGSMFSKWTGACTGIGASCAVTMDAAKTVTAAFIALPGAPTISSATAGNARITLKWTAVTGATSYKIFQGITAGGESSTPVKTGVTGTSVIITGLTNGTKYFFKMAAVNAGGTGALSNEVNAMPLGPPVISSAIAGNAQVTLKWSAVTGATSYKIFQGVTAGGELLTPVKTEVIGTSVVMTGLTNGTKYFFKIAATNSDVLSNEVSATPRGRRIDLVITQLSWRPVNLTTGTFDMLVTLANQGETGAPGGYLDVWANQPTTQTCGVEGDAWMDLGNLAAGASKTVTLTLKAPSGGTKTLRAFVDSWCETTESNETNNQLTRTHVFPPTAPAITSVIAGVGQVTLKWTAVTGATSYRVYQGTTAGGESETPVKTVTGTSATITGLTSGKYYFTVAAVNTGGVSSSSNEVSVNITTP